MAELPIIVLAFANDQEGRRYLRDLPEELRRLQEILKEAERNGLCRLELLPNATLDQIFEVFTRNRDRVTILHYAGHADSGRLLLESSVAGGTPANAAGLATFLGQRQGLQLVFLNGCSTRAQAARLLDAGVASVITTARAIDDGVAREFAAAFYTELASGAPLRAAYEASRGRVLAARGDAPKAYYQTRDLGDPESEPARPDPSDDHGFPWEFRPGNELVERWNLPDAAGNPLLGLPSVPEHDLPESPFRHLAWFATEHAELFFGRGYQIRELYEQITDKSGSPIMMLYGASGVGKSSLLDAGLMPRLKAGGYEIRYCRRDPKTGLHGTLAGAVTPGGAGEPLSDAWHAEEVRLGKPLVIFLDQVEEAYTRTDTAQPKEVDDLVSALVSIFRLREKRPLGKLVLSFRKEWFAEIDRRLSEASLDRSREFLKPLDRRGVAEAVSGPAREGRLQKRYRLRVEDGLPERIADDLVADAGSALSSTLQVLLSKMWELVKDSDPPVFDRKLYEKLKAGGYLLKDVLDEGLKHVGLWNPEVLSSGLVLDVLAFHATDLGTAAQINPADLRQRYNHRPDVLDGLIARCKDLYLLLEADPLTDTPGRPTRMAHDLLAPLVLQRFRLSVAPGQRARRLLENRVPDWADGKTGPDLDRADLASVLEGAPGMRAWTPDEARLVEASRAEDERLKVQEAEEARRLHEAEEGRLRAEAHARKEAEHRLEEQEEANRQQVEANRRLEEANLKQLRTNTHLRQGSYALGAVAAVMVIVACVAYYERAVASNNFRKLKSEEQRRALDQAKELFVAEPQAVPEILKAVRGNAAATAKIEAIRSKPGTSGKEKVRGALALLDKNPAEADFLLRQAVAADTDPRELLLVRKYLPPYLSEGQTDALWSAVRDRKSAPGLRLRNAAVLAALGGKDPRWGEAANLLVANILSVNALQLGDWTDAFRDVSGHLIAPLVKKFNDGDPNEREVAATILNDYAKNDIILILELLKDADAKQFSVLFARARNHPQEAVKAMSEEVAFELLKEANPRQFPILLEKAKGDPPAASKSMKEEVARKPPRRGRYEDRDKLAGRQANALITLAMLGQTGPLWPALRENPDPRLRSYLIQRMGPMGVDFKVVAQHLFDEKQPSVRAALVLALGHYPYDLLVGDINRLVAGRLLAEYPRDPDPGFHSAVAWLLTNTGSLELEAVDAALAGKTPGPGRPWYVNREGQTFVTLTPPDLVTMGSPEEEVALGRVSNEQQYRTRIPRSFAIATREVTGPEFFKFLDSQNPGDVTYLYENQRDYSRDQTRGPVVGVTWFEAARYCRWLSDVEGIPDSQQCYPRISEIKEGSMVLPADLLTRTGYRLPTEAEWEYACRAGTTTPWVFGSDRSLLKDYAWSLNNSSTKNLREQAQTTGLKLPNSFGLFDMHGNVYEWCSDRDPSLPPPGAPPVTDLGHERRDGKVIDADIRIYRGGSFADLPLNLRSAYRDATRPTMRLPAVGFRVVRTSPPK